MLCNPGSSATSRFNNMRQNVSVNASGETNLASNPTCTMLALLFPVRCGRGLNCVLCARLPNRSRAGPADQEKPVDR